MKTNIVVIIPTIGWAFSGKVISWKETEYAMKRINANFDEDWWMMYSKLKDVYLQLDIHQHPRLWLSKQLHEMPQGIPFLLCVAKSEKLEKVDIVFTIWVKFPPGIWVISIVLTNDILVIEKTHKHQRSSK